MGRDGGASRRAGEPEGWTMYGIVWTGERLASQGRRIMRRGRAGRAGCAGRGGSSGRARVGVSSGNNEWRVLGEEGRGRGRLDRRRRSCSWQWWGPPCRFHRGAPALRRGCVRLRRRAERTSASATALITKYEGYGSLLHHRVYAPPGYWVRAQAASPQGSAYRPSSPFAPGLFRFE